MRLSSSTALLSLPLCLVTACATSTARSVSDAELVLASESRADVSDVARALELADLGPLAVPIPPAPTELRPDQAEFWQAAAFAWNPELRQARRRVRELRAASRSAGRPGPIEGQGMTLELDDPEAEIELQAMVDLFGLLGVGPAAAAKELARAETRAALAELESMVWSVRFEVERARVEFAAAKALESAMGALYGEAGEVLPRIEILAQRGWIARGMAEGASAALHMVEHRQAMARADAARMRAELARVCGLDAAHPAFDALQGGVIDRFRPEEFELVEPAPTELLDALPSLRAAKLDLAMAEAELQREARERWPMLTIGPRAVVMPDDTLIGGMFGIDIPFPGALEGRIEAARERRDAAYEALEDALVAARTELDRTRRVYEQALLLAGEHGPEADRSMARMLLATQTEFMVNPERLERWSLAVGERAGSLSSLVRARADLVLAWLDCERARGPRPEVAP